MPDYVAAVAVVLPNYCQVDLGPEGAALIEGHSAAGPLASWAVGVDCSGALGRWHEVDWVARGPRVAIAVGRNLGLVEMVHSARPRRHDGLVGEAGRVAGAQGDRAAVVEVALGPDKTHSKQPKETLCADGKARQFGSYPTLKKYKGSP